MDNRRISLKDLAAELELSVSTVSRALRDMGEISPETRSRVQALAEMRGYSPNPLALGLLQNKTSTIGVILPGVDRYLYSNLLKGIYAQASGSGYSIVTSISDESPGSEKSLVEGFIKSRVDGVIASPVIEATDCSHYMKLIHRRIPLIFVDRDCELVETTKILTDYYNSTLSLMDHLVSVGSKRIALITSLELMSSGMKRFEGYRDSLNKHGLVYDRQLVIHGNLGISTSVEATRNLLSLSSPPDAIVCDDDNVAMAVMKTIKEAGFKIPHDIAVSGFSDDPFSSFLEPTLTSVGIPSYLMGMKAMELLQGMISGAIPLNDPRKMIMESALIERESTRRKYEA